MNEALQTVVGHTFFVVAMAAAFCWGGAVAVLTRTWSITQPGRRWFTNAVIWGGICAMTTSLLWAIILRPGAEPSEPGSLMWWVLALMWLLSQVGPVGAFFYVWRGIVTNVRRGYYIDPVE